MSEPERPKLDYGRPAPTTRWSLLTAARWVGVVSLGFSLLLFIDPYLPRLHVLMLLPVCGAVAGLTLAALSQAPWREMLSTMAPSLAALLLPALSMWVRMNLRAY